jgi:hypothetical protein
MALGRLNARHAISVALVVVSALRTASAQSTPRVFIEGFRANDSLSLQVAAALRSELPRHISASSFHVLSAAEIDVRRSVGEPDDFGHPWNWADVQRVARAYRANIVLDIVAMRSPAGVSIRVAQLRTAKTDSALALPIVTAQNLDQAVAVIVQRLASDSTSLRRP